MKTSELGGRYSINPEYCGYAQPKYVVRFCGTWIGCYDTKKQADARAIRFEKGRWI
jgi:hypothetical protein